MTNKEKQYIKELGQLYICTNPGNTYSCGGGMTCGGGYEPKYKPVDVLKYIEQQEYNEKLNTYMKYRENQRFTKEWCCYGGYNMREDDLGEYVMTEKNKYLNISDLENQLKPEDIQRRVNKLNSNKYKGFIRFSKIQMEGGKYFAYVEDPNGKYIYNKDAQKFIDITK